MAVGDESPLFEPFTSDAAPRATPPRRNFDSRFVCARLSSLSILPRRRCCFGVEAGETGKERREVRTRTQRRQTLGRKDGQVLLSEASFLDDMWDALWLLLSCWPIANTKVRYRCL